MSRNLFTIAGALAALAILISSPFLMTASAEDTVMGALPNDTVIVGEEYSIDLRSRLLASGVNSAFFDTSHASHKHTWIAYEVPSWLTVSGLTHQGGEYYRSTDGHLYLTGTPTTTGVYELTFGLFIGASGPSQPQGPERYTITVQMPPANIYNADRTIAVETGQSVNVDILPYFPAQLTAIRGETYHTVGWGESAERTMYGFTSASEVPSWLTVTAGVKNVPRIQISGTPPGPGTYKVSLDLGTRLFDVPHQSVGIILRCNIVVTDPIPPTPYTVTLNSDPMPTKIETSAGAVTLTGGSATILGGTTMHKPDLQRDRQIVHRWTDAAGNTYDWSQPVTGDLYLTADWRDHFSAAVQGNRATVTLSPSLPTEYTTHRVDWGDNTINGEMTHQYALTGEYTVTVSSGHHGNWVSSSTVVSVEAITEIPTYTVTFNPAGGSLVSSQTIQQGKTAVEPQAPTRPGYNFAGWFLDGKRYDFSMPVTGDLYLSAGWKAVTSGDDDKGEDSGHDLLLIALTVLTIAGLAITLITRSPYAFVVTVVLALIELALLFLSLSGVIA